MKTPLTPHQVLSILIERMEKRADILEQVRMKEYDMAVIELRRFAEMMKKARKHLEEQ